MPRIVAFLRRPDELVAALAHRAFKTAAPGATLYIGFQATPSATAAAKRVAALSTDGDDLLVHGRETYWRRHGNFSDSSLSGAKVEKALGQPTTFRKVTTVEKLAKKLG